MSTKKGANNECVQTQFLKSDYITHHGDFREACVIAKSGAENEGNAAYWDKQIRTLDRLAEDYNPDAEREPLPVLMTRDNPDGFKLEELAEKLRCEIQAKTLNISGDPSIEAQTVVNNNAQIIGLLFQIEALQRQSFAVMAQIRPDEGPEGKPRIGGGS